MTTQTIKQMAKRLNNQHMRYTAGFYLSGPIVGRYFNARVRKGVLEVFDFIAWRPLAVGTVARDHNGRDLFTYDGENTLS